MAEKLSGDERNVRFAKLRSVEASRDKWKAKALANDRAYRYWLHWCLLKTAWDEIKDYGYLIRDYKRGDNPDWVTESEYQEAVKERQAARKRYSQHKRGYLLAEQQMIDENEFGEDYEPGLGDYVLG